MALLQVLLLASGQAATERQRRRHLEAVPSERDPLPQVQEMMETRENEP